MKKYAKEIVLVLITAIVVSVISVSATVYFNSENITFEPDDTNWNVSSTSSALNDLYSYANSGDATASNILVGKTALVNGKLITGTMTNRGAVSATINPGGSYTIPAGYHNGSGKVTAADSTSSLSLVGTYTGNQTIDVSSVARTSDTSNNFIVEIISIPAKYGTVLTDQARYSGAINGTSVTKVLNGKNLIINGATIKGGASNNINQPANAMSVESPFTYKIWHI